MIAIGEETCDLVNRELFFVKDVLGWSEAKFSEKFAVYDAVTKELLVECREPQISMLTKVARMWGKQPMSGVGIDTMTPFNYVVRIPEDGPKLLRVTRGSSTFSVGGAPIRILDSQDNLLCRTEKIWMCIGTKYAFLSPEGKLLFMVQINPSMGRATLFSNGAEVGMVSSQWKGEHSGFFKERFKHAIWISPEVPEDSVMRTVLFGLGLCYYRALG